MGHKQKKYKEIRDTVAGIEECPSLKNKATTTRTLVIEYEYSRWEVDRYCPHKRADLKGAEIINGMLICPKHKWKFDLNMEGLCHEHPDYSIHCKKILDW